MLRYNYSYHLVELSPWPITTAISIFSLLLSIIMMMQSKINGNIMTIISIISLIYSTYNWWKDVIIESTYKGEHTKVVQQNINIGFILFLISEILIFATFFFGYFYNALIPTLEIGSIFPPIGIETLDYKSVPLLNTAVLFFSGLSITAAQNYLIARNKINTIIYLFITIILGSFFIFLQYFEYSNSLFDISDSIYGSSFFLLTGFHGSHMIIGVIFLAIMFFRILSNHFYFNHSLGFSFSAIYYHFIDAVWLFLYSILYIWAN